MTIGKQDIAKTIKEAKTRVRILGVVPLDADWPAILAAWESKKRTPTLAVLCESDNFLFSKALITDNDHAQRRQSFSALRFIRNDTLNTLPPEAGSVEVTHLDVPMSVVEVDDRLFAAPWLSEISNDYEEIGPKHPRRAAIEQYLANYFDPLAGGRYAATREKELLTLYDHDRVPRGIFPRDSFYDTDFLQLVVWALIFDRRGRLLLHKRKENAKDNRSMWDKSVGGHFDFNSDEMDTSITAVREVIEELIDDETTHDSQKLLAHSLAPNPREMIYLGEWRPELRKHYPLLEIASYKGDAWALFRLNKNEQLASPRTLGGDKIRRLNVVANVFVFVANKKLTEGKLEDLMNSDFTLIEVSELKNVMDRAGRNEPSPDFDKKAPDTVPLFTPDLKNIMTSKLRETLEEVSQYIKRYLSED